jgi:hypothetical protein
VIISGIDYCGDGVCPPADAWCSARAEGITQWRITESSTILFGRGHFAFVDGFASELCAGPGRSRRLAAADSRESLRALETVAERPIHGGFLRACHQKL